MGNIIQFDPAANEPHMQGPCVCLECKYEWTGVWPAGVTELECPSCGVVKGVGKCVALPADELIRECKCGNIYFLITQSGHLCARCGVFHVYD